MQILLRQLVCFLTVSDAVISKSFDFEWVLFFIIERKRKTAEKRLLNRLRRSPNDNILHYNGCYCNTDKILKQTKRTEITGAVLSYVCIAWQKKNDTCFE